MHDIGDQPGEAESPASINHFRIPSSMAGRSSSVIVLPGSKKDQGKKCLIFLVTFGLLMTGMSMTAYALYPSVLIAVVTRQTAVSGPDSLIYKAWMNPANEGIPFTRSYTWFNVSNPHEVVAGLEVPNLIPVGPYVYLEERIKDEASIRFNKEQGTVSYKYKTIYSFQPKKSVDKSTGRQLCDMTDVIHVPNMALFGISHRLSKLPKLVRQFGLFPFTKDLCCWVLDWAIASGSLGPAALGPTGIFIDRTVHELLFGYDDPIWELVHPVLKMLGYTASTRLSVQVNGTNPVPSSYTYRSGQQCPLWSNETVCNSSINQYTVEGMGIRPSMREAVAIDLRHQMGSSGNITRWAGQNSLWWMGPSRDGYDAGYGLHPVEDPGLERVVDSEDCRFVEGSDGMRFPPFLRADGQPLHVFLDMAWRKFRFSYERNSRVKGLDTFRYGIDPADLDNENPRNRKCNDVREYGVFNITHAVFGPGLLTKAWFLDTKLTAQQKNFTVSTKYGGHRFATVDEYLANVYGNPTQIRDALDSYIDVHPLTGVSLQGDAKSFINIPFGPIEVSSCTKVGGNESLFTSSAKLPKGMYMPLAILERSAVVSDHWANKLKFYVDLSDMARPLMITFAFLGVLLAFMGPLRQMVLARRQRKSQEEAAEQRKEKQNSGLQQDGEEPLLSDSVNSNTLTMNGRMPTGAVILGGGDSTESSPKKAQRGRHSRLSTTLSDTTESPTHRRYGSNYH